jgi:hypothetical protein
VHDSRTHSITRDPEHHPNFPQKYGMVHHTAL